MKYYNIVTVFLLASVFVFGQSLNGQSSEDESDFRNLIEGSEGMTPQKLVVQDDITHGKIKQHAGEMILNNKILGSDTFVHFTSEESILLEDGFYADNAFLLLDGNNLDDKGSESSIQTSETSRIGDIQEGVKEFSLYPNPTNSLVNIQLPAESEATVQLYDLVGNLVHQGEFKTGKNISLDLNQLSLKKGVYFVVVSTAKDRFSSKVIFR